MPVLLLDLDETLVDRDGAFRAFAQRYIADLGGSPEDLRWLIERDAGGYFSREELADAIRNRFGMATPTVEVAAFLRRGVIESIQPMEGIPDLLRQIGEARIPRVVVTNGSSIQQRQKLEVAGLTSLVDEVVISGVVGLRKPDPRIFQLALDRVGGSTRDSWMVGDHADNDIRGAAAVGLKTAWVSKGSEWVGSDLPTIASPTAGGAIAGVLALLDR
jgi:putative hydrolase of the HAD superfamily